MHAAPSHVTLGVIDAIRAQRLKSFCEESLSAADPAMSPQDRALLEEGASVCKRIAKENENAAQRMIDALRADGITAHGIRHGSAASQYQTFTIEIAPDDVAGTLAVSSGHGFVVDRQVLARAGALAIMCDSIDLMTWSATPMRMHLRWRKAPAGWRRRLRPNVEDIAATSLPRGLSRGYYAVRPIRRLIERLTGRRTADASGLRSGSLGMGTPTGLIAPLLDLVRPGPDDVLLDVGCGDGRILIEAAMRYRCRVRGIERNSTLARVARERVSDAGLETLIGIQQGSAVDVSMDGVSIVFLFLPVHMISECLSDLRRRAAPGTVFLAHEQMAIGHDTLPDFECPVFGQDSITVASIWKA